jgi:hypothetical protein
MTLAIRDAKTRRLLRIVGNPHTAVIRGRLRRGTRGVFMRQWVNYCGPRRPLVYELTLGSLRFREWDENPGARCESAAAPSTLRVFRIRR